jgi:lipoprotein-anchoring transpeptidase ErfK/SrfK
VTPRGRYRIYSRVSGWKTAALGKLYNPLYFKGGFAIHGSGSVPRYPASHGCVRVSVANARWLPSVVPNGTPVHIF